MASQAPIAFVPGLQQAPASMLNLQSEAGKFTLSSRRQLRTPEAAEKFCKALGDFCELAAQQQRTARFRDFDISQNIFSAAQFQQIFTAFSKPGICVERFRIFGTPTLNDAACLSVAEWLAKIKAANSPLELHLSDCSITDIGFHCLMDALASNPAFPRSASRIGEADFPLYIRLENNYINDSAFDTWISKGVAMAFKRVSPAGPRGSAKCAIMVGDNFKCHQKKGAPPDPGSVPAPQPVRPNTAPKHQSKSGSKAAKSDPPKAAPADPPKAAQANPPKTNMASEEARKASIEAGKGDHAQAPGSSQAHPENSDRPQPAAPAAGWAFNPPQPHAPPPPAASYGYPNPHPYPHGYPPQHHSYPQYSHAYTHPHPHQYSAHPHASPSWYAHPPHQQYASSAPSSWAPAPCVNQSAACGSAWQAAALPPPALPPPALPPLALPPPPVGWVGPESGPSTSPTDTMLSVKAKPPSPPLKSGSAPKPCSTETSAAPKSSRSAERGHRRKRRRRGSSSKSCKRKHRRRGRRSRSRHKRRRKRTDTQEIAKGEGDESSSEEEGEGGAGAWLDDLKNKFRSLQQDNVDDAQEGDEPGKAEKVELNGQEIRSRSSSLQRGGNEEENESLPEDWEKHWDETHQLYYYWNAVTQDTTWERPLYV